MPEGVIVGGWSYVIAAYSVVVVTLLIYTVSLFWRLRSSRRDAAASAEGEARVGPGDAGRTGSTGHG